MRFVLLLGVVGLVIVLGAGFAAAQDDLPALADLPAGEWTQIATGGDTICLYGTPYSFFVRPPANSDSSANPRLLIYFEGGGACWDGATCGARGQFAARYSVEDNWAASDTQGLFAVDNPHNPAADAHIVFIPYCSGDLHSGDAQHTFERPGAAPLTVYFNGYRNAAAVLDWVYASFPEPAQVIVAGSSAGGYGATTHAAFVMQQYAEIPVVLVSDAAAGVIPEGWGARATWHVSGNAARFLPGLADVTDETFTVTRQTIALAETFPQNTLAQYNNYFDLVQIGFYALTADQSGDMQAASARWSSGMLENLAAIRAVAPNFVAYTAGGFQHTILADDSFYTVTVDGVVFRDWFAALVAGTGARDVLCSGPDCYRTP